MNQKPINNRVIQANGLKIHLSTAGTGPNVLFITGTNADLRKANSPLHSLLTDSLTVATYDQRGMGRSDKPDSPYTMLDYATDAVAILDKLGWDNAFIAGYSFGGMVAQEIAIRWPERVNRLVLMATTAGGNTGSSYPIHNLLTLAPYERARRSLEVSDLRFTTEWQNENLELAESRIQQRLATDTEFENEDGTIRGRDLQLAARAKHNTAERLQQIQCPTLVIAGLHDGQARLSAQSKMATRIPNSLLETVDGSHGMLYENTETFEKITRFLTA